MRRLLIIIYFVVISIDGYTQIQLGITTKAGDLIVGDFKIKTKDSLTILAKKDEITFGYNEIIKVQTMGVRFIQDAYTYTLSKNYKILEFDEVCTYYNTP